jgi:hypothetical protein
MDHRAIIFDPLEHLFSGNKPAAVCEGSGCHDPHSQQDQQAVHFDQIEGLEILQRRFRPSGGTHLPSTLQQTLPTIRCKPAAGIGGAPQAPILTTEPPA